MGNIFALLHKLINIVDGLAGYFDGDGNGRKKEEGRGNCSIGQV